MDLFRFRKLSQAVLDRCASLVRVAYELGFNNNRICEILLQLAILVILLLQGACAAIQSCALLLGTLINLIKSYYPDGFCVCFFGRTI